jgi:hypothetical protein
MNADSFEGRARLRLEFLSRHKTVACVGMRARFLKPAMWAN